MGSNSLILFFLGGGGLGFSSGFNLVFKRILFDYFQKKKKKREFGLIWSLIFEDM